MNFSMRNFIKSGFLKAIGKISDYWVILNAAGWYDKGVLLEDDLVEIQSAIDARNAAAPVESPSGDESEPPAESPSGDKSKPAAESPSGDESEPPTESPSGDESEPPAESPSGDESEPPSGDATPEAM